MIPALPSPWSILAIAVLLNVALAQEQVTTTVIDVLSNNVEFSYFLRLLQRNQLVPYLNQQTNITLVAPVNSAFAAVYCDAMDSPEPESTHSEDSCIDQIFNNFSLQQLNNYIITEPINTTLLHGYHLFSTVANTDDPTEQENGNGNDYSGGSSLVESPILLHHDNREDETTINGVLVVEPNLFADSQNSFVQGTERVLETLDSLDNTVSKVPNASVINDMKSDRLANIQGKTLLVPIDDSFARFEQHQLEYLFTKYAELDSDLIFKSLIIDGIQGGQLPENLTVQNQLGQNFSLSSLQKGEYLKFNDSIISIKSNILAHGAIIHLFNSTDLIPHVEFNVLKTLVGLKATSFVDELLLQDLSELITNNSIEQTIFYPEDSNQFFSIQSKAANLYHFVDEQITDLDGSKTLFDTYFCNSKKMGDSCQKIKVENYGDRTTVINNNVMVEDGPYKVGNTLIYLTDEDLRTPGDLLSSVNSAVFQCSTSLKMLSDMKLTKLSNNHNGYTFFLPCFDSWNDYSLTLNYLQSNKTIIETLMKTFILDGLLYTDFVEDEESFKNLNDEKVTINYEDEDELDLNLKYNGINFTLGKDNDILFNQGVIHPMQDVFFPEELDISLLDIFEYSDAGIFLDIVKFFPDLQEILTNNSYSILLPSSKSLSRLPPFTSNSSLREMLELHFIPGESLIELFECGDDPITTLHSGVNLTCSYLSESDGAMLQIDGGSSTNGVKILRKGCLPGSERTCVYLIDKPFSLDWLSSHQHYHVSLPGLALGVGFIIGVLVVIGVIICLLTVLAQKRRSTASSGSADDEDENTSLIQENGSRGYNSVSDNNNFESQYSSHTNVNPIIVGKKPPQNILG